MCSGRKKGTLAGIAGNWHYLSFYHPLYSFWVHAVCIPLCFPTVYKRAFSATAKHFHSEDYTFQNLLREIKREASMGPRGSGMKNGARTLGSDLELSRGSLPALAPRQPHRNHLAFLGDKALFCCLSGQGVLVFCILLFWNWSVLHLQAGLTGWGRSQISLKWGTCFDKTGVFITGNRCTTESRKRFVSFLFFFFFHQGCRERGRDTGRERSRLHAGSQMWDSILDPRITPGPKEGAQPLSHPGVPRALFLILTLFPAACVCLTFFVQFYCKIIDLHHCIDLKWTARLFNLHLLWNDCHNRIN